MPSDKSWVETVHQIRTDDSFYYEVGPDPDGLVRADGGRWLGELGKAPPQGMIE